jgi:hypothetical protein
MKPNSNTILLIISTLLVAGAAYWYFFTGTGNQAPLTTGIAENQAQVQFKMLVSELQPISFDTSIFTDPRFAALVDLATPVLPETSGRLDPFAVISDVTK